MYRGGKCARRTHFIRTATPNYVGQNSFVGYLPREDSPACRIIQDQKDKLLTSLAEYFAKEIDKIELESSLTNIKKTLVKDCPAYVQLPNSTCC